MNAWTGETDAGKGGGYDYQWTASALLAINYMCSERPGQFLPEAVHNALGRADKLRLEWSEFSEDSAEPIELQDIVLESESTRVQVQVKRSKGMWKPSKVRDVVVHLIQHRLDDSDYLVFASDSDFHDDLVSLKYARRAATGLTTAVKSLNKSRDPSTRTKNRSASAPTRNIREIDLARLFLHQLHSQADIEWSLQQLLESFMATNEFTFIQLVDHFKKLSTALGGSELTRNELLNFLRGAVNPDFPIGQWVSNKEGQSGLQSIWALDHSKRPTWVPDPIHVRITLRQLLPRPGNAISEFARVGLLIATSAMCFKQNLWNEQATGLGISESMLHQAFQLAHQIDVARSFPSARERQLWPGRELNDILQLALRLNWHQLGLNGRVPDLSELEVRKILWRCYFLKEIRVDYLGTGIVEIDLTFPMGFPDSLRRSILECWNREMSGLVTEFGKVAPRRLSGVAVQDCGDTLTPLSQDSLNEIPSMIEPLYAGGRLRADDRSVANFQHVPTNPALSKLSVTFGEADKWEAQARQLETEDNVAQAFRCWEKVMELHFESGLQDRGFDAFVEYVRLLRQGCWSPAYGRLPPKANLDSLDAVPKLKALVLQALAWCAFGELNIRNAKKYLGQAVHIEMEQNSRLTISLQLARLHILDQDNSQALECLVQALQGASDLGDLAPSFLLIAGELHSQALFDMIFSCTSQRDRQTPEFRLSEADFHARNLEVEKAIDLYRPLPAEAQTTAFMARVHANAPFLVSKGGFFYKIDEESQSIRIDYQRHSRSQSYQWLERAQESFSSQELRSSLQDCLLSLDACMQEGNWVARESAYQLMARVLLKTQENLHCAIFSAIRGESSQLIDETAKAYAVQPDADETSTIVNQLLAWPIRTSEYSYATEALAALADIIPDSAVQSAWERALTRPITRQEVFSSGKLIRQLALRVTADDVPRKINTLTDEIPRTHQEERRDAIVDALTTIATENAAILGPDEWFRLVDALRQELNGNYGPVSAYPRHCLCALIDILLKASPEVVQYGLDDLNLSLSQRQEYLPLLGITLDEEFAWATAQEFLQQRPDPVVTANGYVTMSVTGGPTPDYALNLLRHFNDERKSVVLSTLCSIIIEHDCLPRRRGAALLSLSQLTPEILRLEMDLLVKTAFRAIEGELVTGPWAQEISQKVSAFSAVRTNYGATTIIDRGATALLGALYNLLPEPLQQRTLDHLTRATGSAITDLRLGVATALLTTADRTLFNSQLILILASLIKDESEVVASYAARAAAIQLCRYDQSEELLLVGLIISRIDSRAGKLKRALAIAVATLKRYRHRLARRLQNAYDVLSTDASFRVRKRLLEPDARADAR